MTSTTTPVATVLDHHEVLGRRPEAFGKDAGCTNVELWRDDTTVAGLLMIPSGHRLGTHTHHDHHHHLWLVSGHAVIAGRTLAPNSYAHVPAGVAHDIDATGTDGCTVFYLYVAVS